MPAYKLGGHLPDPKDDDSLRGYWDFDAQLKPHLAAAAAPGNIDLRPSSSPRHNQGQTGSCVAQSVTKALEISSDRSSAASGASARRSSGPTTTRVSPSSRCTICAARR